MEHWNRPMTSLLHHMCMLKTVVCNTIVQLQSFAADSIQKILYWHKLLGAKTNCEVFLKTCVVHSSFFLNVVLKFWAGCIGITALQTSDPTVWLVFFLFLGYILDLMVNAFVIVSLVFFQQTHQKNQSKDTIDDDESEGN